MAESKFFVLYYMPLTNGFCDTEVLFNMPG